MHACMCVCACTRMCRRHGGGLGGGGGAREEQYVLPLMALQKSEEMGKKEKCRRFWLSMLQKQMSIY